MIESPVKAGIVAAMGLVLLVSQGCSMKWLQSDGETGAGAGQGASGKLSGFSQNPSEERLGKGGDIVSLSPSGMSARQRAVVYIVYPEGTVGMAAPYQPVPPWEQESSTSPP